jgi:hypothetical protein
MPVPVFAKLRKLLKSCEYFFDRFARGVGYNTRSNSKATNDTPRRAALQNAQWTSRESRETESVQWHLARHR